MAERVGVERLAEDLARQRKAMTGRCPPYELALALLPSVLAGAPGRFVAAAWEHRTWVAPHHRPLLLLAALRADARSEGLSHPLWRAFAAPHPELVAVTAKALEAALDGGRERVFDALAHRSVQTNETYRAIAWLWPAALAGASDGARPLALADIGASAGLNLVADALPNVWSFEDGAPAKIARSPNVVARLGLDAAPLDAEVDADWLRACVWPGAHDREERLEAALATFRAARPRPDAPVLVPIAARNVPGRLHRLSAARPGVLVLAYQTVMQDCLDPGERAEYELGMGEWIGSRPAGEALWVELEGALGASSSAAASLAEPAAAASIVAHVRAPSGEVRAIELARCGFHPKRLVRRPGAPEALASLVRAGAAEAHP